MIKGFPIEFIQKTLTQVLLEEHNKDNKYFGGDNQILIASFYEQLKTQEEVDRFTEVYSDLVNQQNKTQLIGNGILTLPDNPTYTNLYSAMIIPMTWACSIRTQLKNRDQMIYTINNLTDKLKGRKVDIAQLDVIDENERHIGVPFVVGTIGQHKEEQPEIKNGDFVPYVTTAELNAYFETLETKGVITPLSELDKSNPKSDYWFYSEDNEKLVVIESHLGSERIDVEVSDFIFNDGQHIRINLLSEQNFTELPFIHSTTAFFTIFTETLGQTIPLFAQAVSTTETFVGKKVKIEADFTLEKTVHQYCQEKGLTFLRLEVDEVRVLKKRGYLWSKVVDDGSGECPILFPPEHESFEKYKLSLSFDSIKCNQPRTLNGDEYCDISFGGSATLVNENVALGNDLVKVGIKRNKIVAETPITYNDEYTWLEPLEMPSGNNPSTQPLQLLSNKMLSNTQTDSVSVYIQYSFIADMGLELLKNWFKYARYGRINTNNISPNIIYDVVEYWSSWGIVEAETYLGKIADNIEIDNTESDTLTLAISMQVQGENN